VSAAPALVAVDWGTSNFRALLLDGEGRVLDRREAPRGILAVAGGAFADVLAAEIGPWLAGGRLPVLMSGMIGSRQGWIEAPYAATPAGLSDLVAALAVAPFAQADVHIVPGLRTEAAGRHDVIRGEETQVFGALAALGIQSGSFLLPGTHSKWVRAESGKVVGFTTYMTGELFAAARDHTILGRLMPDSRPSDDAFRRGVEHGAAPGGPGALLSRLFGVRTAGLFGDIPGEALADYLSGLLIGAEIADAAPAHDAPVRVIASHALAEHYRNAATMLGLAVEVLPADCIVAGYRTIARAAGLV
jgi:2-dehydro-3-deoxygalactonokinase